MKKWLSLFVLSFVLLITSCATPKIEYKRWWSKPTSTKTFTAMTEPRWRGWDFDEKKVTVGWWMDGAILRVFKKDVIEIILPTNFNFGNYWELTKWNSRRLIFHPFITTLSDGVLHWWSKTDSIPVCDSCYNSQTFVFLADKPGKSILEFEESCKRDGDYIDTYKITIIVDDKEFYEKKNEKL